MRRHFRLLLIVCAVVLAPAFWPSTVQANPWRFRRFGYGVPVYGFGYGYGYGLRGYGGFGGDGLTQRGAAMASACLATCTAATRHWAMVMAMEACQSPTDSMQRPMSSRFDNAKVRSR
jgi:hypothetical protein